jgi:hypothetical protein
MSANETPDWNKSNVRDFWAEIAPAQHLLQVYENDNVFMNTFEGFVGSGLIAGEGVIVIATDKHLKELNNRLLGQHLDLAGYIRTGQYVPEIAEEVLSRFMDNDWPNDVKFRAVIDGLVSRARGEGRRIRAFGEMVSVLWERGYPGATVHLEHLWNRYCTKSPFTLFCAYPRSGFTQDPAAAMSQICCLHSKVISGFQQPATEVYFQNNAYINAPTDQHIAGSQAGTT